MVICLCHRVSERDIAQHAAGCADFGALQERTGVATACGVCHAFAQEAFEEHRAAHAGCRGCGACGAAAQPAAEACAG